MPGYVRTVRGLGRNARLAIASWGLSAVGTMGVDAVLGNLFVLRLGYGPEFLGLVNSAIFVSMGLSSLPASELGRRWGYRRAMLLGLAMALVGLGSVPLTVVMPIGARPIWLALTYMLAYVGITVRAVNSAPYMMKATSPAERHHAFSVLAAVSPLGAFAGSLAGGLLPGLFSRWLGLPAGSAEVYALSIAVGATSLMPAALALFAASEPAADCPTLTADAAGEQASAPMPLGTIAAVAFLLLFRFAGEGSVSVFFNMYMDDGLGASTSLIGTLMAMGRLVAVPAALAAPLLMGRWGSARTYVVSTLGGAAALLPLALLPRWEAAAAGYVANLTLSGLGAPAVVVLHQSLVPARWRSTMSGAVSMASTVGIGALVYGSGYLIEAAGYGTLFGVAVGLMVTGAAGIWLGFGRRRAWGTNLSPSPSPKRGGM